MATWTIVDGVTSTQTIANIQRVDGTGGPNPPAITFDGDNPTKPSFQQQFQVIVIGSGNVGAAVQICGSNDGQNYVTVGGAINVTSAASPQTGAGITNQSFKYWGAFVTTITGTGATVKTIVSA